MKPKLKPKTKRTVVALDALEEALSILAGLPESPESEALVQKGFVLQREIKAWSDSPPSSEAREAMMRRVLALHIAISQLARR